MASARIPYYRPVSRPRIRAPQVEQIGARTLNPQPLRAAVWDLAQFFGGMVEEDRATKYRAAVGEAGLELRRLSFEMAKDGDPTTRMERWEKARDELRDRYVKQLDEQGVGGTQEFGTEFEKTALSEQYDLQQASFREFQEQKQAGLELSLDNYAKLAGEGRPEQTQQFRDMGVLAIEDALKGGFISPMEAVKRRRAFVSDVVETRVRRDILADPHAAEQALLQGGYEDLDPDERMDLVGKAGAGVDRLQRDAERAENRAIRMEDRAMRLEDRRQRMLDRASSAAEREERRRQSAEDRAFRLGERAERDVADKLQKEGDRLAATGELTATWIENHREEISPDDYRHFYKELEPETSSATVKTDPQVYAPLRERVSEGADVRLDARAALDGRKVSLDDYNRLVNLSEDNLAGSDAKPPGWAKQGEEFIKTSLKVSDINPDPGAPQRQAQAMDQWSDWVRTHPQAKYEEAQKVYRDIVQRTAVVNFGEVLKQTSAPTAAVIKTPGDVDSAEQRLVEEFAAKHGGDETALMNDPDFLRRAEELGRLRDAMPASTAGASDGG